MYGRGRSDFYGVVVLRGARGRCDAGEKYAGLLSVNLDWDRLQALLSSIEARLEGAATKDSVNAVRASHANFTCAPPVFLWEEMAVICMGGCQRS